MILVDTNLIVYVAFEGAAEHEATRRWLEDRLAVGEGSVVLCWPVIYAFLRLVTSARAFAKDARAPGSAWGFIEAHLALPAVRTVAAGKAHAEIAKELLATPGLRSEDVPDVEIAALAIEHGLVLASHDHGFRRFASLRFVDPLAA